MTTQNSKRTWKFLTLIIFFVNSTWVFGKAEIFCFSELIYDFRESQRNGYWRECTVPDHGIFYVCGQTSDHIRSYHKYHLRQNELDALAAINHEIIMPPDAPPLIYIQLSDQKDPNYKIHIESICLFIQEDAYPPLIQGGRRHRDQYKFFNYLNEFSRLKHLELYCFTIEDKIIPKIFSPTNLEYLGLPYNCNDEHLKYIIGLSKLKHVNLSRTNVNGPGLKYISQLPRIHTLDLRRNRFEKGVFSYLKNARTLKTLLLSDTNINDTELNDIADIDTLEHVTLHRTNITDKAITIISRMKNLKYISLYEVNISQSFINKLRRQRPEIIIDEIIPPKMSEFLNNKYTVNAFLGDIYDQVFLAGRYMSSLNDEFPHDLIEALKWYMIAQTNIKTISNEHAKKRLKRITQYAVNRIKQKLNDTQLKDVHRRVQTYMYLHNHAEYKFPLQKKEGLPLYQYGFDILP